MKRPNLSGARWAELTGLSIMLACLALLLPAAVMGVRAVWVVVAVMMLGAIVTMVAGNPRRR